MSNGLTTRKGARRIRDVPLPVLKALAAGTIETVNLMEWLAADMGALARCVSNQVRGPSLRNALGEVADQVGDLSITARLATIGGAIAGAAPDLSDPDLKFLAGHPSDLVRQWACYAVNDSQIRLSRADRLRLTLPFAADRNMTVREAAWMAFRPHILPCVDQAVALLEPLTCDPNAFVRRFAVEVTRPRSVWGLHCEHLKRRPHEALSLLENVRQDAARCVQLAVGNWLNDASKSRPEWVVEVCKRWSAAGNPRTAAITRRGLRTIARQHAQAIDRGLLDVILFARDS